jgi:PAS domain S-box-containing protein
MSFNKKKFWSSLSGLPALVSLATLVILSVLALFIDGKIHYMLWSTAHVEVQNTILPLRDSLVTQVQRRMTFLDALGTYLQLDLSPDTLEQHFNAFAAGLITGEQGIQHFTASPGGVIRYVYPKEGSESIIGTNLNDQSNNGHAADVLRAIQTRKIVLSEPILSTNGGVTLLSRLAVYDGDKFWGFVGEASDLDPLLKQARLLPVPAGMQMALRDANGKVFLGNPSVFTQDAVVLPVNLQNDQWQLAVTPSAGWAPLYANQVLLYHTLEITLVGLLTLVAYFTANRQRQLSGVVQERNKQLRRQSEIRQQTEVRLRQTEAFNSAVLENSLQSYVLVDRDQNILLANNLVRREFKDILGLDMLPGKSMRDFIPPQNWEDYFSSFNRALTGEICREELHYSDSNINSRWFDLTYFPIHLANNQIIGVCVSANDTTLHKESEERFRQSELRFLEIFQANPAAIAIVNREKNLIVTVNERMAALLGYRADALVGKNIDDLALWAEPRDGITLREQIASQPSIATVETSWRTKSSGLRDVIVSASVINLSNEECLLMMVMDNTERRRTEHEREQLLQQLQTGREHLRDLTRQLVTIQEDERRRISRELHDEAGQALTALSISLEMLSADLPEEQEELSQMMADAVELTHTTLDRIRSLAQMLRPPALDALGLIPTLAGQCQSFQRRTQIQVSTYFPELRILPEAYNITFYRCLQEGLTNIARHAHARHVWVELRQENDEIWLCIEDDGQGMYVTGADEGLMVSYGLGLVGLQERLELLDGHLEVDSKPMKGTRLIAHLPLPEASAERIGL